MPKTRKPISKTKKTVAKSRERVFRDIEEYKKAFYPPQSKGIAQASDPYEAASRLAEEATLPLSSDSFNEDADSQ